MGDTMAMAVDTVTDTVSDTAVTTVDTTYTPMLDTDTVTSARGPLMPSPTLMPLLMLTMATTAVDTVTPDTDMVMAVTTVRLSKSYLPFLQPIPHLPTYTQFHKIVFNIMIEKIVFNLYVEKGIVQTDNRSVLLLL